ncbi:hypothetical protein BDV37DRAFT_229384 [Aspergillus pseudonomiae]|uniref:Uncharacterized protein n=1 Tax=Aspergillus pseudonomiae TaxID=1506151 RepID=A0A5N7CZE4_9EURO|nr:uncharacterized protein BDV37DRAFT_229384 [Aspergillus pseudonomiae]KAE8399532.1 hypothetical protein BDV37DRAFT_229384 [Aspergillus pseudonomiae]
MFILSVTNYLSTSLNLAIKPPCREELAPVMNDESMNGEGTVESGPYTVHVDNVGSLPGPDNYLSWSITKSDWLAFDCVSPNLHKVSRRKNNSLPIRNPADGSTKIFYKPTGTANQSLLGHELEPFFTIPGPSRKPIPIKNPLDGSMVLFEKDIICSRNQDLCIGSSDVISQGFTRPTRAKVVVKDPSDMRILNLSQVYL